MNIMVYMQDIKQNLQTLNIMYIFFRMAVILIYSDGCIDVVFFYEASLECIQNP